LENSIIRSFVNFYASPNIIRAINSRRMRWVVYVALMGEMRNAHKFWSENKTIEDHSEDLGPECG
jgi:hypothetical protein